MASRRAYSRPTRRPPPEWVSRWRSRPVVAQADLVQSDVTTLDHSAALALTEAITVLDGGVSDEVFDAAADEFSEAEMVALTWAAAMINTWNRVAITARATPGRHRAA